MAKESSSASPARAPVSWDVATRTSRWVASCPFGSPKSERGFHPVSISEQDHLEEIFAKISIRAEELVVEHTGLVPSTTGMPCAEVLDRQQWSERNLHTFQTILDHAFAGSTAHEGAYSSIFSSNFVLGPSSWATGMELGISVGWLSYRVLGQYDIFGGGYAPGAGSDMMDAPGSVYYVGPNILSLQRKHGFDLYPFGLWIALHETTHRCQLEGVPWLRSYLLEIVDHLLAAMVVPDPERLSAAIKRAASTTTSPRDLLSQGGIATLFASDEQLDDIKKLQAAMSLLEGHGDVVMDDAATDIREEAEIFSKVLKERRKSGNILVRFFQELLGIKAKLLQYEKGTSFLRKLQLKGGTEITSLLWQEPANLPSLEELDDPNLWLERMGALTKV